MPDAAAPDHSPPAPSSPSRPLRPALDPAVIRMALVLVLGAIAPLLDATIVNVALHSLGRAFGNASVAGVQWVATGYLLALALAVPLTGWAADRLGAKRVWMAAQLLFLLGSVLCGLSWNLGSLIAFRVLQGFGGGLMLPVLQTLLLRAAGGRETLGRLMAVVTVPALVAPIFGPVVGGLIIGHTSWRWIFYVNVPICILGAFLAWRVLPADLPVRARAAAAATRLDAPSRGVSARAHASAVTRLDIPGLLLLSPALAALLYGLASVGTTNTFTAPDTLVPLVVGTFLAAAFLLHALRAPAPLIDLSLFRVRSFAASSALLFISGLSMYGSMLLLPLYYQQARHESVVTAGLMLAPQGIGSLLARSGGILTDRLGPRLVLLGAILLTAIGTVPFVFAPENASGTNVVVLGIALVVRGMGLSTANLAVMVGAFRDLNHDQIPHASVTTRIAQQLGASFGTAVLAAILARQLTTQASVTAAYAHTFAWSLAFTALSLIPVLALPPKAPAAPGSLIETEHRMADAAR